MIGAIAALPGCRGTGTRVFNAFLPGCHVSRAARIEDRSDLSAWDERRPERNGNEPHAHDRDGS
jgi:hypothetical protein